MKLKYGYQVNRWIGLYGVCHQECGSNNNWLDFFFFAFMMLFWLLAKNMCRGTRRKVGRQLGDNDINLGES